jgi:transposase
VDGEIIARVERRRQWTPQEKAGLLAEVEASGGQVSVVARRHGISLSLLYNWRSAWKSAALVGRGAVPRFIQLGVVAHHPAYESDEANGGRPGLRAGHACGLGGAGRGSGDRPSEGVRVRVDSGVD